LVSESCSTTNRSFMGLRITPSVTPCNLV
jgi:hypothetical protein